MSPEFTEEKNTPENFQLTGRTLYLTTDPALIRTQIEGTDLEGVDTNDLLSGISTDEIIPNRHCLRWTGHEVGFLGDHLLTGLRGGIIAPHEIANGNFQVVVAGPSFARGSSRYHAPLALKEAGINVVAADMERIFFENCVNAGIYPLTPDSNTLGTLLSEGSISHDALRADLSPLSQDIMKAGNLIKYLHDLETGKFLYPEGADNPRPMTMIEKILAKRAHRSNTQIGVNFVKPGEEYIVNPDTYYGYELQTTAVRAVLEDEYGDDLVVRNPQKTLLFNDHTALLSTPEVQMQQDEQVVFSERFKITNFENDPITGAPAICHTAMLEDHALPGQLILGNDSHTCTLGAVNALAIGKGAADLAAAMAFDKMVVTVPQTIRIELTGKLGNGATMKDFMLQLGATPDLKEGRGGSWRVFEFGGEALEHITFDEQIKMPNMAVELQGYTGIIEPNTQMVNYLRGQRGLTEEEIASLTVTSDSDAEYFEVIPFDLSTVEPTVATPGDTQNGVPLSEVEAQNIQIQKAYIGSCTHGTPEDLRQAAEVMEGKKVAEGVKLYVQASSMGNLQTAETRGYVRTLLDAGAELLPIGCGACMNAGPGSTEEGEVGIFATNRNYPGRTGRGETYLANPAVVAASAIKGTICGPESLN